MTTTHNNNNGIVESTAAGGDNSIPLETINLLGDAAKQTPELNTQASKTMELFEENDNEKPPLSKFLNQIINFHSIMPSSKEMNEKLEKGDEPVKVQQSTAKLGTVLGVFLPCVQNIFGVILFIRASWIVGVAGSIGAFCIVFMCCSCTLLTAISMSAIATNGVVPAGGPYFMVSRSLGPECGGAVGILFYLGNTVAAAMYIVGAVEIFLKYMCPQCVIIGDIEVLSDAFNNFRIYGTLLLILIGFFVFIGIKFVSKIAPISLVCVLLSVICIYIGVIKSAFDPPDLKICVFNETRLIRYEAYASPNGVDFYCTNQRDCFDSLLNKTITCPLWEHYCGPLFEKKNQIDNRDNVTQNIIKDSNLNETFALQFDMKESQRQRYVHLCTYFELNNSVELRQGIPGISSKVPVSENYKSRYFGEGEVDYDVEGVKETEVVGKGYTSFLILIGIYFPSVTGIMAGSNRSGDLKDPSRSLPRGTIAAIVTTSVIYLSNTLLFASCIDGLLLRDKFGDSINKQLVISVLAWPSKWVILVGAFASTLGAALQSLTSAPRLLQAVAKDDIIPFLRPLASSFRGEPFRALMMTLVICESCVLIGNLDNLTPFIAMFFLMCYGFVNTACALQTILKAPSWRPRFKYYHWSLSLLGLFLCVTIMFIVKWYYAILSIALALCIYKYIEYKGAEKEWGDGMRGLSMSAARYALLRLEEAQPHVKNWRPQILILVKTDTDSDQNIRMKHPNLITLASQLKAGKGLTVSANVIAGDYIENVPIVKQSKKVLKEAMAEHRVKGFCDSLVAQNVEQGICHLIQTEGLGGLRHNTIIMNWPSKFDAYEDEHDGKSFTYQGFVNTLRFANANESSIILTKGIDDWPIDRKTECQEETIDIWWIIHDGGLLLLIVFLLKRHKIWQKCKLRLFTVAHMQENSVQMKNDLIQYMYHLRIEAEVDVIEMPECDISAYTYDKTLKLEEREKLLKDLKLSDSNNEPQSIIDRVRRSSLLHVTPGTQKQEASTLPLVHESSSENLASSVTTNKSARLTVNSSSSASAASSPRKLKGTYKTETMRKMNTAIELNKKIVEKSKSASLVLLNIPAPPKQASEVNDFSYMEYVNVLADGLNRVLLVRGTGREVITIFS